jgi:D-xylose 1-dehydrogenase (NADP+, D-xylono-1,5-lactone-forming)
LSDAARPVGWGVIGATANIAQLAVLPALAASPSSRLVAVASASAPDGGYADFGAERVLASYAAVLDDADVEAVYVPLPNSLHAEWTIRAAEAGKHVLCEKPLASTALEAGAMAAACDAAGVLLFEAYMTPFHPRSERFEAILRSGRLGELRFARTAFTGVLRDAGNHRWSPAMGGGALLDVGIYCLAPLLLAAGRSPVKLAASAVTTASGVDSSFAGWLDFGRGMTASFECSFETPERQRIEVVGTEGALTMERTFTPGVDDTALTIADRSGAVETIECGGGDPYLRMVEHVSAVVRGRESARRTPSDAIEVATLIDRLRVVAEGGS